MNEYCEECEEIDGHLIGCAARVSHLKHAGNFFERTKTMPREKAFAEVWKRLNTPKQWINNGYICLENILLTEHKNPKPMDNLLFRSLEGELTERDCFVAASVVQWLGTNCGQCFLDEVKRKINSH